MFQILLSDPVVATASGAEAEAPIIEHTIVLPRAIPNAVGDWVHLRVLVVSSDSIAG